MSSMKFFETVGANYPGTLKFRRVEVTVIVFKPASAMFEV